MKKKKIPAFKNINEEKRYREMHDSTKLIDWKQAKLATFPYLKLSIDLGKILTDKG